MVKGTDAVSVEGADRKDGGADASVGGANARKANRDERKRQLIGGWPP
jgi:hypothetical protein